MASFLYVPVPKVPGRNLLGPKDTVKITPSTQTIETGEIDVLAHEICSECGTETYKTNSATIKATIKVLDRLGFVRIPYSDSEDAFTAQKLLASIKNKPNNYLSIISRDLLFYLIPFLRAKNLRIIRRKGEYYLEMRIFNSEGSWAVIDKLEGLTENIISCFYIFGNIYIRTENKLYEWEDALTKGWKNRKKRDGPAGLGIIHNKKLVSYTISPDKLWINDTYAIRYYNATTRDWHILKLPVTSVLRPIVWNNGYLYLLPGYSHTLKQRKYVFHKDFWRYDPRENVWIKQMVDYIAGYPSAESSQLFALSKKTDLIMLNDVSFDIKTKRISRTKPIDEYVQDAEAILPYILPFVLADKLYPTIEHTRNTSTINTITDKWEVAGLFFLKLGPFQLFY